MGTEVRFGLFKIMLLSKGVTSQGLLVNVNGKKI